MENERKPDVKMIEWTLAANRKRGVDLNALFLDFDGVINVFYEPGTKAYEEKVKRSVDKFDFAEKYCIEHLNQLSRDFNLHVIISSSWRFGKLKGCIKYLVDEGMDKKVNVFDTTQIEVFQSRQLDIEEYLLSHPVYSNYVILDDMEMPALKDHLVQTDPTKGWDDAADQKVRAILKKRCQ